MTKYWLEFSESYISSPLSCWAHFPVNSETWSGAEKYSPPLPKKDVDKGFVIYKIEHKGFEFVYSSVEEIEHCIDVLSPKVMKSTIELANDSWVKGYQHTHWFTKWPGAIKSYKDRQQIVKLLSKVKKLYA